MRLETGLLSHPRQLSEEGSEAKIAAEITTVCGATGWRTGSHSDNLYQPSYPDPPSRREKSKPHASAPLTTGYAKPAYGTPDTKGQVLIIC